MLYLPFLLILEGMRCIVKGEFNTILAVVCSIHSEQEHNGSITGLFLPGHSMSMCLPLSCAPLASQAERMINYTMLLHAD